MTSRRILIGDAIRRGSEVAVSVDAAIMEIVLGLKAGNLRSEAKQWGLLSEIGSWSRNSSIEPVAPLPLPSHAWETADLSHLREGRLSWKKNWLGSSPPWGNVEINFAHGIHVDSEDVYRLWPSLKRAGEASLAGAKTDGGSKRSGGRPKIHDWAQAAGYAAAFIVENDYPNTQAELERALKAWFERTSGKSPDDKEIKNFVRVIYEGRPARK